MRLAERRGASRRREGYDARRMTIDRLSNNANCVELRFVFTWPIAKSVNMGSAMKPTPKRLIDWHEEDCETVIAVTRIDTRAIGSAKVKYMTMNQGLSSAFDAGRVNVLGAYELQREDRQTGDEHDRTACIRHVHQQSITRAGV